MEDIVMELNQLNQNIEDAFVFLDEALQRCQEFPYKDWDSEAVAHLIKMVKIVLKRY